MPKKVQYYLVDAGALPEVFLKVVEARRLLSSGEVRTINAAADRVGISRSAFYKYKDAVWPFHDMLHGHILTFQFMLKDEPGVLSAVLNIFAETGGNILTINQGIPVSGVAAVTIGAETSEMKVAVEELLDIAMRVNGVLKCETLAG
ncbi:MAG: ACT domain-containing protein [Oscillospiraceae bacterium]